MAAAFSSEAKSGKTAGGNLGTVRAEERGRPSLDRRLLCQRRHGNGPVHRDDAGCRGCGRAVTGMPVSGYPHRQRRCARHLCSLREGRRAHPDGARRRSAFGSERPRRAPPAGCLLVDHDGHGGHGRRCRPAVGVTLADRCDRPGKRDPNRDGRVGIGPRRFGRTRRCALDRRTSRPGPRRHQHHLEL